MNALSSIGNVKAQLTSAQLEAARKDRAMDEAAQDFVAVFMAQMIQPMFDGVEVNKEFGGGHGEDAMKTFLMQEYGKAMAKTDKSGLADSVKAELIKIQEGKASAQAAQAMEGIEK